MPRPLTPFQYPGSKATKVDWIESNLPEHRLFVDVFGGSGSVIFNKDRSKREVYNDADGDLANFFSVVRDRGDELQEYLGRVEYGRSLHEDWMEDWQAGARPDDDLERAARFFFLVNATFNGYIADGSGFSTHRGNESSKYWNRVDRLDRVADRFRSVTVESMDYVDLYQQYDSGETLFYADPPYVGKSLYAEGVDFDHQKLIDESLGLDGSVVISYDELPDVSGVEEFRVVAKDTTHHGHHREATERLLINSP